MSSFYFKAVPVRRGLTGVEMLAGFLDEQFPGVKFNPVISDGIAEFGILTGTGDILPKAISAIEGRFSACRLSEQSFIGVVAKHYNPVAMEGQTVPTLDEYLTSHGITPPADSLVNIKAAKKQLLKEIAKKKFADDNDSIADLCKATTLLTLHYDALTVEEKAAVDALSTSLKAIYTKDVCMSAYSTLVGALTSVLTDYYAATVAVDGAADAAAVEAVELV